jgi:hypothetical protein
VRSPGVTLMGMTHVRADVAVTGHNALLVGRLWDVDPATGASASSTAAWSACARRKLVSFDLNGNAYKFARGHQIKLELLGRDSPTYRAANGTFSVTVQQLRIALPTRERSPGMSSPWRGRGDGTPTCIAASTIPTQVSVASATCTHTISAGRSSWNCSDADHALRAEQQADPRQARAQLASAPRRRASHHVATASTPSAAASTPWRSMSQLAVEAP